MQKSISKQRICFFDGKGYADRQDVTEQLKKDNPYEWIGRMNNIQACVREVVGTELIYNKRFTVWLLLRLLECCGCGCKEVVKD